MNIIKVTNIENAIWANSNKTVLKCTLTIDHNGELTSIDDYYLEKDIGPDWAQEAFNTAASSENILDFDSNVCHMETLSYVIAEKSEEEIAREKRNSALKILDLKICNPLRWQDFTAEQKEECALYRQALLDVPQQEGFPANINWPELPVFLR